MNHNGSCNAPLKFYEYLKKGLSRRKVYSLYHYPCLFKYDTVIIVSCVDDCIFFSIKMENMDSLIKDMEIS